MVKNIKHYMYTECLIRQIQTIIQNVTAKNSVPKQKISGTEMHGDIFLLASFPKEVQ